MKIHLFNQTKEPLKAISQTLKSVFNTIEETRTMQIVLLTNEAIHEMNLSYRGKDYATDVLSFPSDEEDSLGDIFISLEKAHEQALQFGHSFERELAFLAVHGYLHLKGYDHETKEEEINMMALTEKILERVNLSRRKDMRLEEALQAMSRAYTPYSNFQVGAAILLKTGEVVLGSNIENASYGLCNCAERSALFSLISQGYAKEDIVSVTITGNTETPISPCGACRQVMYELLPDNTPIYLTNTKKDVKKTSKEELLPYGFKL